MYGQTIDSLRVLQQTDTNTIELFSKYGQQSNSDTNWKTASIDIYHNTNDLVSMSRKVLWYITLVNNFTLSNNIRYCIEQKEIVNQ